MDEDRMGAVREAAAALSAARAGFVPRAFVVLGSGLSGVLDELETVAEVPFGEVPGMAETTVPGHAGRFVLASADGVPLLVSAGRLHLYEGHAADAVVLPVRAARLMGATAFVATNASGAVSDRVAPGDLMLVADHLNLTGTSPLIGANLADLGPRFPRMAGAYSPRLAAVARECADALGTPLAEGVYAGVLGSQFETPAEVRALAALGADAVGMSTVTEVVAAAHAGMECLAISAVTNAAGAEEGHDDVLATARGMAERFGRVLLAILSRL